MTARFFFSVGRLGNLTFMQYVLRPTRKSAVYDRAYNLSHGGWPEGDGPRMSLPLSSSNSP